MSRLDQVVAALRSIAEELDELALEQLQQAAAEGRGVRPSNDKQLMQARRAIDKAIHVLIRDPQ